MVFEPSLKNGEPIILRFFVHIRDSEKIQEQNHLYIQNFLLLLASHTLSNLVFITDFKTSLPFIDSKLGENVISWSFFFGCTFETTLFYSLIDFYRKSKYQYYSKGDPGVSE